MGLLDDAARDLAPDNEDVEVAEPAGSTARLNGRDATVMVGGEETSVQQPETVQTDDESGTWLSGTNKYGKPRGTQALENRQIVQTSAMQAIVNGVADQVLGGELTFEMREDVDAPDSQVEDLKGLLASVLKGPHVGDATLDDLIVASIEEMMGPGQAYWQLLPSEDGSLPVASIIGLDSLTIRHNVNKHGFPETPKYYQAQSAFSGSGVSGLGSVDPTPLEDGDLAVMSYPRGHRFNQTYPISPAWQVRQWLEILANSTTHHNRFYSDSEQPPGILQFVGENSSGIQDIKEKLEDASGDPREVPVVGPEGGGKWIDMGGQSINLNVIEEQRWFFFLCLGCLGLGKAELGFIEDANRSNGEVESTRVYKRVAEPFIEKFEGAFSHIASQFDAYNELGEPFQPTISFSDPREERAREQRLREMYQAGGLTLREYVRRRGDTDLATDDERYTVEVGGEVVDYGDHPMWVAKALLSEAGADVDVEDDAPEDEDGEE